MALSAHHASARKIVLTVDQLLEQLEGGHDTSVGLQSQVSQHLNALAREVQALEELLPSEAAAQRSLWRKRITQLQDQSNSQRAALSKFASRHHRQEQEAADRDMLLSGRHGGGEHAILIDGLAQEGRKLNEAGQALDGLTDNAHAVLRSLGEQRGALKGVQRKVLDMANTLGLSNGVIRAIESRQFWDKMLVYGGMLFTLLPLWFAFVYLRRATEE